MHHVTTTDAVHQGLGRRTSRDPAIRLALERRQLGRPGGCDRRAGFRVIAYDRRGFGRSSQPWSGYDYDTLSDDLATVIQQTEAQDATVVGFSMGGGEVARYMSRHGGKSVIKAALISSVVPCLLKSRENPEGTEQAVFDDMATRMRDDRTQFSTDAVDGVPHEQRCECRSPRCRSGGRRSR